MSLLPFGIFDIVNDIFVELARRRNAELISSALGNRGEHKGEQHKGNLQMVLNKSQLVHVLWCFFDMVQGA